MGRPNVINEPKRSYNLLISIREYELLRGISISLSKAAGHQVSIAHLLREGAKSVIDYYEKEKT